MCRVKLAWGFYRTVPEKRIRFFLINNGTSGLFLFHPRGNTRTSIFCVVPSNQIRPRLKRLITPISVHFLHVR